MKYMIKKINLISWQIQEDIIEICANLVNKEIFKQIVETGFLQSCVMKQDILIIT